MSRIVKFGIRIGRKAVPGLTPAMRQEWRFEGFDCYVDVLEAQVEEYETFDEAVEAAAAEAISVWGDLHDHLIRDLYPKRVWAEFEKAMKKENAQ